MDAEDDADQRADQLPNLEVKILRDDDEKPQHDEPQDEQPQDDDVQEEVQDEPMEGVGSQEGEETQEEPGYSEKNRETWITSSTFS